MITTLIPFQPTASPCQETPRIDSRVVWLSAMSLILVLFTTTVFGQSPAPGQAIILSAPKWLSPSQLPPLFSQLMIDPSRDRNQLIVLYQPTSHDGCGCDESNSLIQACDPDGFILRLDRDYRDYFSDRSNSDCDDCSNIRIRKFESNVRVRRYMNFLQNSQSWDDFAIYPRQWQAHFNNLIRETRRGNLVLIATCDPD